MSFEPAHKAQPVDWHETYSVRKQGIFVAEGNNNEKVVCFTLKALKRELSEWAGEVERLEKREQNLKNKIEELAVEFESWRTTNDSNLGFSFGVFLKQHSEELLGLSKQ